MDFIDQREIKFNVEKNSSTEILNFWKIGTMLVLLYSFSTVNNIDLFFNETTLFDGDHKSNDNQ